MSAASDTANTSITLSASTEYQSYGVANDQCWAVVSLKAPFYEPTARAPVDIIAVIDKSGSMRGTKIEMVKKTLVFVIDQLKECDRFSLVTYDTHVELVFGLMKMDKNNKERAKDFVKSLRDGSSTNLCGGLIKGMEQIALTAGKERAQVQSVLLLTDGLANHWITTKEGIISEMKKMQDSGIGAVSVPLAGGGAPNFPFSQVLNVAPPAPKKKGWFGSKKTKAPVQQRIAPVQQRMAPMQQQMAPVQQQMAPIQQQMAPVQQQMAPMQQQMAPMQQQMAPELQQMAPVQQQVAPELQQMAPELQQVAPELQQMAPELQQMVPVQQQMAPVQQQQILPQAAANLVVEQGTEDPFPKAEPMEVDAKFDGTVYTFGFGSDHNSDLLEGISTQGGGVYYYIDSTEKIPESFADCLGGLLSVMAQNLSLKLEALGDSSFKAVHANRTIKWQTPNKSCEIPMGDLQSEEERDIVLELVLPALSAANESDPTLKSELSYFNVITSALDTVGHQLDVNRSDGERGPGNMAVDLQRNRIITTTALKEAESLADFGNLQEAKQKVKAAIVKLESSKSKDEKLCKVLLGDLKRCLDSMTSQQAYRGHGKLALSNMKQSHSVQRSNYVGNDFDSYSSSSKQMYKSKAKFL